ncbi:uncharacterized protein FIESC28_07863 [Fusarium coffeatum]|uniref:Uncharacterized protein n=1 Tax=Fusarium coffeatum TaxID=231269 RepID=A0A366RCP8_9HYPO|nr:uncharacterized protein FIESC28_07863 [Fusarium coffeatum]RBR14106.1 hypothetical protein FIESC28_07863 [Fusarium coffeatum]
MSHSHSSNRATHGSSNRPHSPRPVSDPTVAGAGRRDHTAVQDLRTRGNAQPPANSDDLGREIDEIWEQGDKLPAQMPRPSYAR